MSRSETVLVGWMVGNGLMFAIGAVCAYLYSDRRRARRRRGRRRGWVL